MQNIKLGSKFGHLITLEDVSFEENDRATTWVKTRCTCQVGHPLFDMMYSLTRVDLLLDDKVTDCNLCYADAGIKY